jgi:hypothetical protein
MGVQPRIGADVGHGLSASARFGTANRIKCNNDNKTATVAPDRQVPLSTSKTFLQ